MKRVGLAIAFTILIQPALGQSKDAWSQTPGQLIIHPADQIRYVPKKTEIEGLVSVTRDMPPVFQYALKDGTIWKCDYQIKGVPDKRPFKAKHPFESDAFWKFRGFCKAALPIAEFLGAIAQIFTAFR